MSRCAKPPNTYMQRRDKRLADEAAKRAANQEMRSHCRAVLEWHRRETEHLIQQALLDVVPTTAQKHAH